jgi:hypothetical protein
MSSPARTRFMLGNETIRHYVECLVLAPAGVEVKKEPAGPVRGNGPLGPIEQLFKGRVQALRKMKEIDQGGSYRRGIRIATPDDREDHAEGSPIEAGSK